MKNNTKNTHTGFKVPEDYFEQLTDRVLKNAHSDESISHAGFSVPKDYFTNLENRIVSKIEEEKEDVKVITLQPSQNKKWLYPLLAIAAVFIGFIAINGLSGQDEITFADLGDQEISDYLEDVNFLEDDESLEILYANNNILYDTEIEQDITDSELLDYLMEDDTMLNQIIIE